MVGVPSTAYTRQNSSVNDYEIFKLDIFLLQLIGIKSNKGYIFKIIDILTWSFPHKLTIERLYSVCVSESE